MRIVRVARRRSVGDADEYDEMSRRRRRSAVDDFRDEESFEERALDAVDMLPEGMRSVIIRVR